MSSQAVGKRNSTNVHKPGRFSSLGMNVSNRRNKRFLTAFTLIELLMVIAIIALLMSILIPVVGRARQLVKAVICRSNLRQWGIIFLEYTGDNNGFFHEGWDASAPSWGFEKQWTEVLRPYSGPSSNFWCCPMAARPMCDKDGNLTRGVSYTFLAWGIFKGGYFGIGDYDNYGSYGINGWVCNPPRGKEPGRKREYFWRSASVRRANSIPLFLDGAFVNQWPYDYDMPPLFDGQGAYGGSNHIGRFRLNRHNGFINGLFVDFSARKIGLKELWKLKWHRDFDLNGPWTPQGAIRPGDWPEGMRKFKDYY